MGNGGAFMDAGGVKPSIVRIVGATARSGTLPGVT